MQMSRTVSTSNTFIKPWYAFAQVSVCGVALPTEIQNTTPGKPDYLQNHPKGAF